MVSLWGEMRAFWAVIRRDGFPCTSLASGEKWGAGSAHSDKGTRKGLSAGLGNSLAAERILNFGLVKLPCHYKGSATSQIKNLPRQIRNVSDAELLKSANTLLRFYVV